MPLKRKHRIYVLYRDDADMGEKSQKVFLNVQLSEPPSLRGWWEWLDIDFNPQGLEYLYFVVVEFTHHADPPQHYCRIEGVFRTHREAALIECDIYNKQGKYSQEHKHAHPWLDRGESLDDVYVIRLDIWK